MSGLDIQLDRLTYPGSGRPVLEDLHISAEPGEFVAILGPSGCGKTSLLHAVAGLNRQFKGAMHFNGSDLSNAATPVHLGCMFQEPRLMPWLTVAENVGLVLERYSEDPRIEHLLEAVGLANRGDDYPNQLSGGMRRRAALARAFVVEPDLLLLDEPFISLDAPTADRLRELLVELWQGTDAAVVLVTHDLREAVAMADRLIFLSPQPARVVHETRIGLPRPRRGEDTGVSEFCRELLDNHPRLLEGIQNAE